MPEAIILAVLSSPAAMELISSITLKIVAEIFHRRATDPNFLASSDITFAQVINSKTDEEQTNALKALQDLMSTPRS